MHGASVAGDVAHGHVLDDPVVPERDVTHRPAPAAGERVLRRVVEEEVEQQAVLGGPPLVQPDGVLAVHVEGVAPGLGISPHDGMPLHPVRVLARVHGHAREQVVHLLHLGRVRVACAVDPGESAQGRLQTARQRLEREVLVGEERVASVRGNLEGVQDRAHRGLGQEREVGVPDAAEGEALRLAGLPDHGDDLGVVGDRLDERDRAVGPEPAGERGLSRGIELLVPEEDHLVVEDRPPDLGHGLVVETGREIDTGDHGAARAGPPVHGDPVVRGAGGARGDGHQREHGGHACEPRTARRRSVGPHDFSTITDRRSGRRPPRSAVRRPRRGHDHPHRRRRAGQARRRGPRRLAHPAGNDPPGQAHRGSRPAHQGLRAARVARPDRVGRVGPVPRRRLHRRESCGCARPGSPPRRDRRRAARHPSDARRVRSQLRQAPRRHERDADDLEAGDARPRSAPTSRRSGTSTCATGWS